MKKMIFLFAVLGILLSCSINRPVIPNHNNGCLTKMDSLSILMEHIKFGVYSVHLDAFSIEKYKGLSTLELAINGVPIGESDQKIFEFEAFLKRFSENTECTNTMINSMFIEKIGTPYEIAKDGSFLYLLKIGKDCPNCNYPINRIFEGCSHIRIYFDQTVYKRMGISLHY
jgi:hypothetical protein